MAEESSTGKRWPDQDQQQQIQLLLTLLFPSFTLGMGSGFVHNLRTMQPFSISKPAKIKYTIKEIPDFHFEFVGSKGSKSNPTTNSLVFCSLSLSLFHSCKWEWEENKETNPNFTGERKIISFTLLSKPNRNLCCCCWLQMCWCDSWFKIFARIPGIFSYIVPHFGTCVFHSSRIKDKVH